MARKKKMQGIKISCEVRKPSGETELVELSAGNRRELDDMTFLDLRGRTRLAMEGEPLLSNLSGPAVVYPDGDEDFFVNGVSTDEEHVPFYRHHAAVDLKQGSGHFVWGNTALQHGLKDGGKVNYGTAILECDGDEHAWLLIVGVDDDEIGIWLHMDFFDADCELFRSFSFDDLDLEPEEIFHTAAFGDRLLLEFVCTADFGPRNWRYLNEDGRASLEEQLKDAFAVIKQEREKKGEPVPAPKEEPKEPAKAESSGFGTMVAAGLATVAIGALGAAALKDRAPVRAKEEVRA